MSLFQYGLTLDYDFWNIVQNLDLWFHPFEMVPDDNVPEWSYIVCGGWYMDILPWCLEHHDQTILIWGTEAFYMEPMGLLGGPEVYVV